MKVFALLLVVMLAAYSQQDAVAVVGRVCRIGHYGLGCFNACDQSLVIDFEAEAVAEADGWYKCTHYSVDLEALVDLNLTLSTAPVCDTVNALINNLYVCLTTGGILYWNGSNSYRCGAYICNIP